MKIALVKDQDIVNGIENALKPTVVPNGVLDPKPMNVVDTSKSVLVLNIFCVIKQEYLNFFFHYPSIFVSFYQISAPEEMKAKDLGTWK